MALNTTDQSFPWEIVNGITRRIRVGQQKWRNMSGVLYNKKVPLKFKKKFYKVVVRLAIMYSAECWPIKGIHVEKMIVVEMEMI